MLANVLHRAYGHACAGFRAFRRRMGSALRPATTTSLILGAVPDLARNKPEVTTENALLRQQLLVLARSTRRPCRRVPWSADGECPGSSAERVFFRTRNYRV